MSNDSEAVHILPGAEPFTNAPLRYRVATVLREAILNGDLAPGTPLTESAIADQLQVSRAPVREAIRTVAKEGLIVSEPYRGSRVRSVRRRDVQEVYGLRGLYESFAVERIVEMHDANGLRALEETCGRMRERAVQGDMKGVTREDEIFHRRIIEAADHELLLATWTQLSFRVRQIMSLRNRQMEDPIRVADNHHAIVEALATGRLEEALARVREHVRAGTELVIDGWDTDA